MNAKDLIGMKIKSSVMPDTKGMRPAPRDHVVKYAHKNEEDGMWWAWSETEPGHGEHLRANDEAALIRRVMSLK